jgi:hypothetical protein
MSNQSADEKRQAKLDHLAEVDADIRGGGDPRAARGVAPGECWAVTDHPTVADLIFDDANVRM